MSSASSRLAAKAVPWGNRERAAEMTKLMADHRQVTWDTLCVAGLGERVCGTRVLRRAGVSRLLRVCSVSFSKYGSRDHKKHELTKGHQPLALAP